MKKEYKYTITLKQVHKFTSINDDPETVWSVIGLTDSVEFEIGQTLEKSEVESLCRSAHWKVIIK